MSKPITYKKKNNKYVFNNDGVHFTLTVDKIFEMSKLFSDIALLELGEAIPLELKSDNLPE